MGTHELALQCVGAMPTLLQCAPLSAWTTDLATLLQVDTSSRPFKIYSDERTVEADTVVISTGAVAKRLEFKGSNEGKDGYWNKGISACAVCDGAAPMFR